MGATYELDSLSVPIVANPAPYYKAIHKILTRTEAVANKIQGVIQKGIIEPLDKIGVHANQAFGQLGKASIGSLKSMERVSRQSFKNMSAASRASFSHMNREMSKSIAVMKKLEQQAQRTSRVKTPGGAAGGAAGGMAGAGGNLAGGMMGAGVGLSALAAPFVLLGGMATKASIDFESSFAGVRKTVNATAEEFAALETGMRNLSKTIPVNVNELNKIGESAGQLGIKTQNLLGFTEVMAKLGVTTNLSSDQAATELARLANITGMAQTDFDRLGSTIVGLGNNFATTEAEISSMALRIAGAGKTIGLAEHEIMAIGAALSSLGIEAEAGGSAISKLLIDMASNVSTGGKDLAKFAAASRMSIGEFSRLFKADAAGALQAFITGLNKTQQAGGDTLNILAGLGIEEVRMRDAVLRLAGSGEILNDTLRVGAQAWAENTALNKEAAERFKTTASQIELMRNRFSDVLKTVGDALIPILRDLLSVTEALMPVVSFMASTFAAMPYPIRLAAVALTAVVSATGAAALAIGGLGMMMGPLAGGFLKATTAAKGFMAVQVYNSAVTGLTYVLLAVDKLKAGFVALKSQAVIAWAAATGPIGALVIASAAAGLGILKIADEFGLLGKKAEDAGDQMARAMRIANAGKAAVSGKRMADLDAARGAKNPHVAIAKMEADLTRQASFEQEQIRQREARLQKQESELGIGGKMMDWNAKANIDAEKAAIAAAKERADETERMLDLVQKEKAIIGPQKGSQGLDYKSDMPKIVDLDKDLAETQSLIGNLAGAAAQGAKINEKQLEGLIQKEQKLNEQLAIRDQLLGSIRGEPTAPATPSLPSVTTPSPAGMLGGVGGASTGLGSPTGTAPTAGPIEFRRSWNAKKRAEGNFTEKQFLASDAGKPYRKLPKDFINRKHFGSGAINRTHFVDPNKRVQQSGYQPSDFGPKRGAAGPVMFRGNNAVGPIADAVAEGEAKARKEEKQNDGDSLLAEIAANTAPFRGAKVMVIPANLKG